MITQVPRARAVLLVAAFALACFGLTLFVWLELGGSIPLQPRGYRFHVLLPEASQLTGGADVRISGISVGRVVGVAQRGERADVTIQMSSRFAPVPADTRALLRQKTLLGETFVALTPGSPRAPKLRDGGTLAPGQVMGRQGLDQLLNAFDAPTRRNFKALLAGTARALSGRGADLNAALGEADPATSSLGRLVAVLDHQSGDVRRLVRNTGVVLRRLGDRRADLQELIRAGDSVLAATASRDRAITATVRALPPFLGDVRGSLTALDRTGAIAGPSLATLRPVAPLVPGALATVVDLVPRLQALLHDLRPFLALTRRALPAATQLLRVGPALTRQLEPAAKRLVPLIDYIQAYRREVVGTFANVSSALEATSPTADGPLHYLRTLIVIGNEGFLGMEQRPSTNRHNPYFAPGALADIGHGGLAASDCRNTANTGPAPETPGSGPPPCRVQPPWTFRGRTRYFQHVAPEP